MSGAKTFAGRWFEEFEPGQTITHAGGRTLLDSDGALYLALTGDRRPLHLNRELARQIGYPTTPLHDLVVFNLVFGQTVMDISFNAVANLGYAGVRFLGPVFPGDTLSARSEVIGRRQTSRGDSGVVYVRTTGVNQHGQAVLEFCRWVLVRKRDPASSAGETIVPELPDSVPVAQMAPPRLVPASWNPAVTGGSAAFEDYRPGERLDHPGAMTLEEADHMAATRWYQNTARPHFEAPADGRRLVYGGHVISLAYALAFNGLHNGIGMAAWNGGSHLNPTYAGDCLHAVSEVLEVQPVPERDEIGLLRLRLLAYKNGPPPSGEPLPPRGTRAGDAPNLVLDLDYWLWIPTVAGFAGGRG